jgi:ketosteroid isomerase-like protein
MSLIARFAKYAAAFEEAYKSDDWSVVAPYFAEDAVYEIRDVPAPLGGRFEGRAAVLAYFKAVLDGFDRRFGSREIALVKGPREGARCGFAGYVRRPAFPHHLRARVTTTLPSDLSHFGS